jgi:hypothetical protein
MVKVVAPIGRSHIFIMASQFATERELPERSFAYLAPLKPISMSVFFMKAIFNRFSLGAVKDR